MTRYVHTTVDVGYGKLVIDGNSKINLDDYYEPTPNALSLPHVSTCPGATPTCLRSCYVNGLQRNAPDVCESYRANEATLHRALMTPDARAASAERLGAWIGANVSGFRWHVSGDVMCDRHAWWIVDVCRQSPCTPHWIYTRTLQLADVLCQARNLSVNLSADADNWAAARRVAEHTGARLCFEASGEGAVPAGLRAGDVIFPDYPLRGRELDEPTSAPWWQGLTQEQRRMVCPADFFGQSERHRCGPCKRCLVRSV